MLDGAPPAATGVVDVVAAGRDRASAVSSAATSSASGAPAVPLPYRTESNRSAAWASSRAWAGKAVATATLTSCAVRPGASSSSVRSPISRAMAR